MKKKMYCLPISSMSVEIAVLSTTFFLPDTQNGYFWTAETAYTKSKTSP